MPTFIGTNQSETLSGTASADIIKGKQGDDTIYGLDGADDLRGGGGKDTLFGGDGWDQIKGGGGRDVIHDGAGFDQLWGGGGRDTFVMDADGFGDHIRDWETRDTIDLSALGVTGMDQLNIVYQGGFATIYTEGDGSLILSGRDGPITAADLTADKFIFAAPQPTVVDFETIEVPNYWADFMNSDNAGHAGFDWSQTAFILEKDEFALQNVPNGVLNSAETGTVAIGNVGGYDMSFSKDFNFALQELHLGAMFNDGLTVKVTGYDDGVATGDQLIVVDTSGSITAQMDQNIFGSVDEVLFESYGGTFSPTMTPTGAADTSNFYIEYMVVA